MHQGKTGDTNKAGNERHKLAKTLIIGFGNIYRRDDGVGFAVVNALRKELGRAPLDVQDDGFNDLGHEVDTLVLHQLVPELAEMMAHYDLVVFVDAHVASMPEPIYVEEIAACYKAATVPHQLAPGTLLALARELYHSELRGILISLRGEDFDFGEGLSEHTGALIPEAVAQIQKIMTVNR